MYICKKSIVMELSEIDIFLKKLKKIPSFLFHVIFFSLYLRCRYGGHLFIVRSDSAKGRLLT